MPQFLVKLGEKYVEWSTVVDAPVTAPMTRGQMGRYLLTEYGRSCADDIEPRLARCDANGTSMMRPETVRDATSCNRAGPGESRLSFKGLVAWANDPANASDE